jgi:Plant transposon protein
MKYLLNGSEYDLPYYCADGIYPQWGLFVHTIPYPTDIKEKMFTKQQEDVRKDIARAFGVLSQRFQVLQQPCRLHDRESTAKMIQACILMHNMVVESRRNGYERQCWKVIEILILGPS